jgi:hypothetical protein
VNATFKQYAPADLFINMEMPDTMEADDSTQIPTTGFRPTGCAFLDAFVQNLHQHGARTGHFHAQKLGIKTNDLFGNLLMVALLMFQQFIGHQQYIPFSKIGIIHSGKNKNRGKQVVGFDAQLLRP